MGGFLSIFSPPSPPPPPPPPPIYIPPPQSAAASDTAEEDKRKARLAAVARNRAGMAGTVATTARGVLTPAAGTTIRKTLLGE